MARALGNLIGNCVATVVIAAWEGDLDRETAARVLDGKEVIDTEKRTGRILQVGSQRVSSVVYQKAKELIEAGAIGEINLVEAWVDRNSAIGAWQYSIPPDASPATIDWDRFLGRAPIVVRKNQRAISVVQLQNWIGQGIGDAVLRKRRPERACNHFCRQVSADDEAADHDVARGADLAPRRNITDPTARRIQIVELKQSYARDVRRTADHRSVRSGRQCCDDTGLQAVGRFEIRGNRVCR